MVCIELRNDGWFEFGEEYKDTQPVLCKIYQEKQRIKSALEGIGEQPTIENLGKKVAGINLDGINWEGSPYVLFLGKDLKGERKIVGTYVLRDGVHRGHLDKVRAYV